MCDSQFLNHNNQWYKANLGTEHQIWITNWVKKLPPKKWVSLSTPLFNLEIYFDKVPEHDSYFRGAGLSTWLPMFLVSVESEINTEERQQVSCEAEGVEGKWTKAEMSPASLVAQMVKNLPAVQETWVRSLGWEDPLEKEPATHYSIFACRIP